MENLKYYNMGRQVPQEAKKSIGGGRLKGMTDINPMWRIKKLTEMFGVCGIGWKYEIEKEWIEKNGDEQAAFIEINLYIKNEDKWSDAIPGVGGSMFVTKEKNGLYTSDECFKMALTDALSVSCKALGIAADVYFDKDKSKYDVNTTEKEIEKEYKCEKCSKPFVSWTDTKGKTWSAGQVAHFSKNKNNGVALCFDCSKAK
jgi:DNA-directed RNA polymerase subunit RPC12/RpoP